MRKEERREGSSEEISVTTYAFFLMTFTFLVVGDDCVVGSTVDSGTSIGVAVVLWLFVGGSGRAWAPTLCADKASEWSARRVWSVCIDACGVLTCTLRCGRFNLNQKH